MKIQTTRTFDDLPEADIFFADSWQVAEKLYALRREGLKFEYVQHDERMYHGNPEAVDLVFRLPMKKIVDATWLQEMFDREYEYRAPIVMNAIDCKLFHPLQTPRSDNTIRIMLLHHDYQWKGTKEGVDIVRSLQRTYPNIKLVLFGTRQPTSDYPCDEYHYNVFGGKLADLFRSIDIYLCPSWDEGLCFPPRWAMASGCALVTYDNGSSRDYAFDGDTALVAKRKDIEDLARKLKQLVQDPALRARIAHRGLEYVRTMPTWEQLTDTLEAIFKQELNNHA